MRNVIVSIELIATVVCLLIAASYIGSMASAILIHVLTKGM